MTHPSNPPTPPPKDPADRSAYRFEPSYAPTEWIESYRPGGVHPIHPGDQLDGSRYAVVCKLGYGAFSTVWLAQDQRRSRLVAIKVARADARQVLEELRLHKMLAESDVESDSMKHVVMAIDDFTQTGPNGEHQCLVFEPMGPSAGLVLEGIPQADAIGPLDPSELPPPLSEPLPPPSDAPPSPPSPVLSSELPPPSPGIRSELPPPDPHSGAPQAPLTLHQRKTLLKQLLLGLHCLHGNRIAHGDVNPGNLLLCIKPPSSQDVQKILTSRQNKGKSAPVRRVDGKQDRWAPRYLYTEQPLTNWADVDQTMLAKISDLGAAFTFDNPPAADKCVTPAALRAPEILLQSPIDHNIDIWSFGCLVYEFLTGCRLFQVSGLKDVPQEQTDDDHFLQMIDTLGQPPLEMFSRWPRARRYFDENLQLVRSDVGSSEVAEGEPFQGPSLEDAFRESLPEEMGAEEAGHVLSLLRMILQYEPSLRPTTSELLEHQWFRSVEP